ncbi:MAG: hypothetical protein KAU36_02640, partial [candidate division Zixibacteria bacterium]|nr:hypothetical protein [candidate division Zixibacteria bacterium]
MRRLKNPLLYLTLLWLLALGGVSHGQVDCDIIGMSPNDTVRVVSTIVAPGDTLNVPIWIKNIETNIASFQIYLEFDETLLQPIVVGVDSLFDSLGVFQGQVQEFYDYYVTGRFLETEEKLDSLGFPYLDTVTRVQAFSELDFPPDDPDLGRLKILALPELIPDPPPVIRTGEGDIMLLRFAIPEDAPDGYTAVGYYTETIEIREEEFPYDIIRTDCLYSRYGDSTGNIDRRLTTIAGTIKIETGYVPGDRPTIVTFGASPTTIESGQSSTLSWEVVDATSLTISPDVGSVTPVTAGSVSVSPTSTTQYTLTATNAEGSVAAMTTVTIGTAGDNTAPTISPVAGSPFTISQGESVSFTVNASDADGDNITLSAISLPNNATFSEAVGTGSVSSNFSFTPDVTQSGQFVATFRVTDSPSGASTTLSVVINVTEILMDRLFTTSADGLKPVGGLRGNPAVYFPINLITSQTVYGVQFDFEYDPVYFEVDSFVVTGRTVDYVVYDNIDQTPGSITVLAFGLANEPIVNVDDTTAILYAVMSIDSAASPGDYPVTLSNGWESVNPDPDVPSLELAMGSGIIQVDQPGDVNLDKRINVADLVNIVAQMIHNFELDPRQFDCADVIINDTVDVFDLVGVINIIYGLPVSPAPQEYLVEEPATIALEYNDLNAGGSDMMVVRSELPTDIAAVQLEINYDPATVILGTPTAGAEAAQLALNYRDDANGRLKVLLNFTNPFALNELIQQGGADLLNV